MPFVRIPFKRFNEQFECRFNARSLEIVYNRDAVKQNLISRNDPEALFAKAELDILDADYESASKNLHMSLDASAPEQLDFKGMVNQQLFKVEQHLARHAILGGIPEKELASCLAMYQCPSTLAEEMHTIFALSDAYVRTEKYSEAGRCLRTILKVYNHYEYPIPPAMISDTDSLFNTAKQIIDKTSGTINKDFFSGEMLRSMELMKKGLPLYFSILSPLPRTLTVRAGELAARRLIKLQDSSPEFAQEFKKHAAEELASCPQEEKANRIREFPATPAAQKTLEDLFKKAAARPAYEARKNIWGLTDIARTGNLAIPAAYKDLQQKEKLLTPLRQPFVSKKQKLTDENTHWIVLERSDSRNIHPELLFLGGRIKKRLDNKFKITCIDLKSGAILWKGTEKRGLLTSDEIRLKGKGDEAGFVSVYVYRDMAAVHGLYDVLAFSLKDGTLKWRYRTPFDFEILHAVQSGDFLILTGSRETIALYLPTKHPQGEVAWQVKEMGDIYTPPYVFKDRFISLRKMPFNLTVRFRATGNLIGRLELPDLSLDASHPLIKNGPEEFPSAHDKNLLAVTDNTYYIMIDVEKPLVIWKRLIDFNPYMADYKPMRFALKGTFFSVLKHDHDREALHMLSADTGKLLWHTDPDKPDSPRPMHSLFIQKGNVYGIEPGPGQGFTFTGVTCREGKNLFSVQRVDYNSVPSVGLLETRLASYAVLNVQDRQDFELNVFNLTNGSCIHTLKDKGVGPFGVHGRVSAAIQAGRLILLSGNNLNL